MKNKPPQPGTEDAPYTMGMRVTVTLNEHSARALNQWLKNWKWGLETEVEPSDSLLINYALARGWTARDS